MMPLVILITGASRGIGLACAEHLAARRHRVFGGCRTAGAHLAFTLSPLDVRDDDSVREWVEDVLKQAGRIDVLINNAGVSLGGAVEEASPEDARALFETNLFGVLRVTNAVLPHMRANGGGRIINISSLAGRVGVPYLGLYAASKHALEGYSATLRYEVRRFGVQVSLVEPGDIRTGIMGTPPSNIQSAYDGERERATAIHDANVRNAPPPERVARVVERIITTRYPRQRYTVTHGGERIVPLALRLLPDSWVEWLARQVYRLGG
jgi:NAD(P)-dependent dehydrogenase (short-subunit alcohol dehydrogenase family)